MRLAQICGTVVATEKSPGLKGCPLLVVDMLDFQLKPNGERLIVIDRIGVGPGEKVILSMGREATLGMDRPFVPADGSVVGIYQGGQYMGDGL